MSEYVKFIYERANADIPAFVGLGALNAYRRKLLELQLVGVDSNGVSFGNLSMRNGHSKEFYVTGSATGALPDLTTNDCAKVIAYDFKTNWVRYEGTAVPSSESLTHAAIYESALDAAAVIHCHDSKLWLKLLDRIPTTAKSAEYGTPQMACEIVRLFNNCDLDTRKILVMGGHHGGIVTFGESFEEAFAVLVNEQIAIPCSR